VLVAGCRNDDDIRSETANYEEREPIHLRVAILKDGAWIWFFRLDGPASQVKEHLATFDEFVKSAKFTGKKNPPIEWKEPKEWKKDPPIPERHASWRIAPAPRVLEVKVTKLPAKDYSLMANMHRWQKQVNLPLSEEPADNEPYLRKEIDITWVDMKGLGVHTVTKPSDPMAANDKEFLPGIKFDKPAIKTPFTYVVPEGWEKGEVRGGDMADIYNVADGEIELTLTRFGGDGGGLAANINRWRKQVGLPELPPQDAANTAHANMIPDMKAYYVDIANPAGPAWKNHILGVIIPIAQPKSVWFVKMTGDAKLVGQHKNEFESFVKSFTLNKR
jgi:hypothetical protein